jgi:hypothetical protein
MRIFSNREKEIISHLRNVDPLNTCLIHEWLTTFYFKEEYGRALILQNQGEYAVLFLKTELFNDNNKRNREVKQFFELLFLLNYLNINGHIAIYRHITEKMHYLQDGFNAPKITNNIIFLNTRGDYSQSPDTICDKNKNVIYKGVIFRDIHYHLILNTLTGSLLVLGLPEAIDKQPQVTPPAGRRKSWAKFLFYTLVCLICAASIRSSYLLYVKMEKFEHCSIDMSIP